MAVRKVLPTAPGREVKTETGKFAPGSAPGREPVVILQYKELVAKISQDAKDRMLSGKQIDPTLHGAEPRKSGEVAEVLAEIAGTGIVQLNL